MKGETILAEAVDAYRTALGDRLLAAYALGSLAHGGFSELVSDIDLGLILTDPLRPDYAETVQSVADSQRRKGSPLHERLSVFWGTPSTLAGQRQGGRFPPLDRLDLLQSGRLLAGSDEARAGVRPPSQEELVLTGAEFALGQLSAVGAQRDPAGNQLGSIHADGSEALQQIRSGDLLAAQDVRQITKLVLFPVRFLYTAATGRVGTNHDAAAHYLEGSGRAAAELVQAALAWRTKPPADPRAVAKLLREQMVALYVEYIDDHVERLRGMGRDDLASAFEEWRRQLLA